MREKMQKMKLATFMLFVVSVMIMSFKEVRAEDPLYVLTYQMEYKLDEETQTAMAYKYQLWNDSACTEFAIPSKITHNEKEYTVTSIREGAFAEAEYLEKVQIPATITEIGSFAFQLCTALKEVNLPVGLKKVSEATFYGCESLESIEISAAVTVIEPAAFYECKKLKKVVIPNGVTYLGTCCFFGCTGLEEVVIPNSVKTIEDAVFLNCDALTQVVIPESVELVPSSILLNCDSLESVIYPDNVKESFLVGLYEDKLQFSYIINSDGTVSVTVENIPEGMTEINLPTDIGGRKITSITGPEGVELEIVCSKHSDPVWDRDMENHWYTCVLCKKEIRAAHSFTSGSQPCECGYVPFSITAQPSSQQLACGYKTGLLAVTVKKTFGKEAVSYQWLEDGKAIAGATAETYAIPKGKKVGTYTYTCKITSGGYSAVTTAVTVTVKAPVKGGKYKDDSNMATYKVTKASVDGKGTVQYVKPVNKKKKVVTIPATVKIGGVTYKVTAIAKNAFKNNKKIRRVTIEKNVEKIGARAFYGCKNLKNITIKTKKLKAKNIGANAFKNIKSNAIIKVPKKKIKIYKTMLLKKGVGRNVKIKKI